MVIYDIEHNKRYIRKFCEKKGKIRKTWSLTKKRSSEMLTVHNANFKNVKSWSTKNFSVPPNSAPGLRHCPSPFPSLSILAWCFNSIRSYLPLNFNRVSSVYGRRIATHSADPSFTHFLGEFPAVA